MSWPVCITMYVRTIAIQEEIHVSEPTDKRYWHQMSLRQSINKTILIDSAAIWLWSGVAVALHLEIAEDYQVIITLLPLMLENGCNSYHKKTVFKTWYPFYTDAQTLMKLGFFEIYNIHFTVVSKEFEQQQLFNCCSKCYSDIPIKS
jgi:hypothetical protein